MPARIAFVQYLLPDGRRSLQWIERPDNVIAVADKITSHEFRFECEVLTTGHASFTIHDKVLGEDVAIEICENGPEVGKTVDKLVFGFNVASALKQRAATRNPSDDD